MGEAESGQRGGTQGEEPPGGGDGQPEWRPIPRRYGGPGRRGAVHERWQLFLDSPFFPATVLVLILAAAAGFFAGSYTYAMADPTPHRIPTAVVATEPGSKEAIRQRSFIEGMERTLGASLDLRHYDTYGPAREAVEDQRAFAVLRARTAADEDTGMRADEAPGRGAGPGPQSGRDAGNGPVMELDIASASGASVAEVLAKTAPKVGKRVGVPVRIEDIKPLQRGDPRGLVLFYISLAAVIVGFVGAIQMSVHARALNPAERIAFTAGYALLGGFAITAVVDWLLDALDLPFVESWLILALTMFSSGMVFSMFNAVMGRWAMIPTWGLMVLIGNPSSGGAVSWPLLPSLLGHIGRWLPPGASINAQHSAVYFPGHQDLMPYLVLAGWALLSCAVFWIWRHRHPGGRPLEQSAR